MHWMRIIWCLMAIICLPIFIISCYQPSSSLPSQSNKITTGAQQSSLELQPFPVLPFTPTLISRLETMESMLWFRCPYLEIDNHGGVFVYWHRLGGTASNKSTTMMRRNKNQEIFVSNEPWLRLPTDPILGIFT